MRLIIIGMIIGIANIIPGVSGGTMAVVLKVYDKIISAISDMKEDLIGSIKFLAPIGIGGVGGIVLFSKLIEYTLENYAMATNMVFVGLILGSIPMIYKSATKGRKNMSNHISLLVCFIIIMVMNYIQPSESSTVITSLSGSAFAKLFFVSILSAGAMIIPGISGSFVMLLLGAYTTVLTAISDMNVMLLIPVGLGCIVGIIGCAKIIDKLFKKYKSQTYYGILGFMIGSVLVIFPEISVNTEFFVSLILLVVSSVVAYLFSKN